MDFEIAIVGAGHAGLLAANWLATAGFSVIIVDPSIAPSPESGRTLALLGGSQDRLEANGLWNDLRHFGTSVHHVDVGDVEGSGQVAYHASEVGVESLAFGFRQYQLRNALLQAARKSGRVKFVEASFCEFRYRQGYVTLELSDGKSVQAELLIGADGRQSRVRRSANIAISRVNYQQVAKSFLIHHERSHRHTVVERMTADGPLAILPVGDHACGVTWVGSPDDPRTADELARDLSSLIGGRLGGIEVASKIDRYPLSAQHARRYVSPGMALIGDAAHGVHPIHAQGFNMGVADIDALVGVLTVARDKGLALGGAVLRGYETARWSDNQARLRMTDGLNRLFSNDLAILSPVRQAVLGSLATFAPLRQRAIRHGMRLTG